MRNETENSSFQSFIINILTDMVWTALIFGLFPFKSLCTRMSLFSKIGLQYDLNQAHSNLNLPSAQSQQSDCPTVGSFYADSSIFLSHARCQKYNLPKRQKNNLPVKMYTNFRLCDSMSTVQQHLCIHCGFWVTKTIYHLTKLGD